jgi:hypothetical protein
MALDELEVKALRSSFKELVSKLAELRGHL